MSNAYRKQRRHDRAVAELKLLLEPIHEADKAAASAKASRQPVRPTDLTNFAAAARRIAATDVSLLDAANEAAAALGMSFDADEWHVLTLAVARDQRISASRMKVRAAEEALNNRHGVSA